MSSFFARLQRIGGAIKQAAQSDRGRRVLKILRHGVTVAVIGYLVYQMTQIGWREIWRDLPTTPWFYIIFLGLYFLLPVFQSIAYRLIWNVPFRRVFPPVLKASVYNKEVLNYSGEVYLFSWARTQVDAASRQIAHHIKDNTIVSAVASTLNAVVLLSFFLLTGMISLPFLVDHSSLYVAGGLLAGLLIIVVGVRFRRTVFKLSSSLILTLFGLYMGRLFLLQGLQVTQWAVVIPDVPLQGWFTFLAVQIILSRLPFLPSKDLIFMAVGLEMAGAVQVPKAALAGVLVVQSMLDKGLSVLLFSVVSLRSSDTVLQTPSETESVPEQL